MSIEHCSEGPHIGRDGVGAKWEESLVVTDNDAYWLDDTVSHLRV